LEKKRPVQEEKEIDTTTAPTKKQAAHVDLVQAASRLRYLQVKLLLLLGSLVSYQIRNQGLILVKES